MQINKTIVVFVMSLCMAVAIAGTQASAQQQEVVWVQIEAHPNLGTARQRAATYASDLADVNGFSLGGSWYGIVLGPYLRSDAEQVLRVYRSEGQIPRDSYIVRSNVLGGQYWPPGVDILNRGTFGAPTPVVPETDETSPQATLDLEPADETPSEARRSERLLTAQERRDLQIALRWGGYYNAAIDGAYGPGTRRSMAAWQGANGYETTGILTTKQRRQLMDQYNAPLISAGMQTHRDARAGLSLQLPLAAVKLDRYDPPFVHFGATGSVPEAKVLLISQPGDQKTLFGLYEIMQTLEIVPLEGTRDRRADGFVLEGRNNRFVSHTEVTLEDDEIKGFTLIWPTGDEERRQRVLATMQDTFQTTPGALDLRLSDSADQDIDLVSGLEVRTPRLARSGFFIDRSGVVVTTSDVVQSCTRVTLDKDSPADIVTLDDTLGVAILRPQSALAPIEIGGFAAGTPRLRSEVAVSGYSFEGILGAPSLTFGTLADTKGLSGERELTRLALASLPGDAGGPVLDAGGQVLGMLLPEPDGPRKLPEDVSLAANATAIQDLLSRAGVRVRSPQNTGRTLDPLDLSRVAEGMTVLVNCWD